VYAGHVPSIACTWVVETCSTSRWVFHTHHVLAKTSTMESSRKVVNVSKRLRSQNGRFRVHYG
jgi:hypothetical protein